MPLHLSAQLIHRRALAERRHAFFQHDHGIEKFVAIDQL